jgi:hypothetical protein
MHHPAFTLIAPRPSSRLKARPNRLRKEKIEPASGSLRQEFLNVASLISSPRHELPRQSAAERSPSILHVLRGGDFAK